jgi:hypothetical protein
MGKSMRVTESALRRIIREELLSEAPLDDIVPVDLPNTTPEERGRPTVAHPETRTDRIQSHAEFTGIARDLMRSTKDRWVIITFSSVGRWRRMNIADRATWIEQEKEKYPGAILAFVNATPVSGDYTTPKWVVVHDLMGHSIETIWAAEYGNKLGLVPFAIINALHDELPEEFRISDSPEDRIPDILAGILLEKLTLEQARRATAPVIASPDLSEESRENLRRMVESMFAATEMWLEDARAAGFVNLKPW